MQIQNVSGHRIEQRFEGKTYVWRDDGDVLSVGAGIGGWLMAKLNGMDSNPAFKKEYAEKGDPDFKWVKQLDAEDEKIVNMSVIYAAKAKKAEAPAAAKPAAPSK